MPFEGMTGHRRWQNQVRRRFRAWAKESGLTQKQLGDEVEWEQQTVSCYFAGSQDIDLIRAITWCDFFGYTITDLLSRTRTPHPNPRLQRAVALFHRMTPREQDFMLEVIDLKVANRRKR
jgi:transcriptional regulator with XRE-family HTH domain